MLLSKSVRYVIFRSKLAHYLDKRTMFSDEVLKRLIKKLMKEEYQRVLSILKTANSVVGDELEHLLTQLQVERLKSRVLPQPTSMIDSIK